MAFQAYPQIVGSMQTLKRDVKNGCGVFPKGSQVLVTDEGDRGYSIKDPASGATAIECGFDCFELKE